MLNGNTLYFIKLLLMCAKQGKPDIGPKRTAQNNKDSIHNNRTRSKV